MTRFRLLLPVILGSLAAPALADPAVGLWRTEPDRKDLTSLIRIEPCGRGLCGTVSKAFDEKGREVRTPNVGETLFWDLRPQGAGTYGGGTVHVPLLDVTASARARLRGDTLQVTACKGPICDGQVWTRAH